MYEEYEEASCGGEEDMWAVVRRWAVAARWAVAMRWVVAARVHANKGARQRALSQVGALADRTIWFL